MAWPSGHSTFNRTGPGEGRFAFSGVTLGIVLSPLPSHHAAYGGDRRSHEPLSAGQGWLFPAGFDGWCRWDEPNDFLNLELGAGCLADAGLEGLSGFPPSKGNLDPLLVQLGLNLHAAGRESSNLYRDSLALAVAVQLANVVMGTALPKLRPDLRLHRALQYIEDHLAEDISLADLAAAAAMSPFHFSRCFKAQTGLAPYAFVVTRRMEKAKELLRATRLPIAEIAWRVGYMNSAKFAAQFRRLTGATPGEWRKH
ncbi:hypothetical protein LCM4573_04375 [Rhizobium sp. LCM 4573]|nr:hypothetical protein LCM4573_04375 [Rhizobium sp. LCM 4573]